MPLPAAPPTPLKTISHVYASPTCTTLRENVGVVIQGILINDRMIDQGRILLYKVRRDGIAAPLGAGWSGGAGPSSSLDDVQMENLVGVVAKNLEKLGSVLNGVRGNNRDLVAARAHLEDVVEQQRRELNILSGNVLSNESADLQSRKGLAPPDSAAAAPQRLSMIEELAAQQDDMQPIEQRAALSVKPLIDGCR